MLDKLFKKLVYVPRIPVLFLIRAYQRTFSPDHGLLKIFFPRGYCKYYPSCSQYAYEVIQKRGLVVGGLKAGWRLVRCNPYSKGGMDLSN